MGRKSKGEHISFRVTDMHDEVLDQYCVCFEDWSDEMKEAAGHKACWYEKMKDRGAGVKLVSDKDGRLSGLIQYIPGEYSPLLGTNFYFIYCIWVHGHKKGMGNRQGHGMGTALLQAAEEDIRSRGASGIAAWGLSIPVWMKSSWYRKHGYAVVRKNGIQHLLWKPLTSDAVAPKWREKKIPAPSGDGVKVSVTSIRSGICPVMNISSERSRRAAASFGAEVSFTEILSDEPETVEEWGINDVIYINKKEVALGPPLSERKIRGMIIKQLKRA